MFRLILRGIAARKLRSALTALSILLGAAMISGTFTLINQITGAFDDIFAASYATTDAVVRPKAAVETQTDNGAPVTLELEDSLVDRIEALSEVERAAGARNNDSGFLRIGEELFTPSGGAPGIVATRAGSPFDDVSELVEGEWPVDGEIALDQGLAEDSGAEVGQEVEVVTATGAEPVTVSGIIDFPASTGGATIIIATLADQQKWFEAPGKVTEIAVSAADGVSAAEVTEAVNEAVGSSSVEVKTAEQVAKDDASVVNEAINQFLTPTLLVFAVVAVLVGAFIIFNTFSITVAQRLREIAMLRTIGASRAQIRRSVLGEALVVAIVSSSLGIAGGFAVAAGIVAVFELLGAGIPATTPTLTVNAVVWPLVVGIGATAIAAFGPAMRATRIAPVEGLREGAALPPGRLAKVWPFVTLLVGLGGFALIAGGLTADGLTANQRLIALGAGFLLVLFGAAYWARYVVRPVARVTGRALPGTVGRLARENAMRNPSRTAVTAAAVMIGLGMVVFVAVFVDGLKASVDQAIRGSLRGDVFVANQTFARLSAGVLDAINETDGVAATAGSQTDGALVGDENVSLSGVDPDAVTEAFRLDWVDGDDATLEALGPNDAVIDRDVADATGAGVGDTTEIRTANGERTKVTVRGLFDSEESLLAGMLVTQETFEQLSPNRQFDFIVVTGDEGVSAGDLADRLTDALEDQPAAQVQTIDELVSDQKQQLDGLVLLFFALLSLSVLISLVGVVNTLLLSIFERTREIGMLRAVGQTRWQTRWMITGESVITAVLGAILGIVIGLALSWVMALGLESEGIVFSVPTLQLVVALIGALIAGTIAAIFPARRAAKLNPLEALRYE